MYIDCILFNHPPNSKRMSNSIGGLWSSRVYITLHFCSAVQGTVVSALVQPSDHPCSGSVLQRKGSRCSRVVEERPHVHIALLTSRNTEEKINMLGYAWAASKASNTCSLSSCLRKWVQVWPVYVPFCREVIATSLKAVATRVEAIASRVKASLLGWRLLEVGSRRSKSQKLQHAIDHKLNGSYSRGRIHPNPCRPSIQFIGKNIKE